MFVESYTLTVLSKCTEGGFQTEKWTKTFTFKFHIFLESFSVFLGDGEQRVADGIRLMDGGMVVMGQRSSKSTFVAKNIKN